jgi:ring-1,2-phenylacetyl-CoA epoxidase subunit PaaD
MVSAMVTPEQTAIMRAAAAAAAARAAPRPSLEAIWHALGGVPDPEIPVVSVVELGIVRGVEWDRVDPATLIVRVTPTYSGCPATELIVRGIEAALAALGVVRTRIATQLAPAWTTDWMTADARRKLAEYGIAPPSGRATVAARVDVAGISPLRRATVAVACPRCGSSTTTLVSQFGSTACKAQYRCESCREPFDYFKPH